jgi:hypothetical protein
MSNENEISRFFLLSERSSQRIEFDGEDELSRSS